MRRLSPPLYVAYGSLTCWLGYCALQSARNGALWTCAIFTFGSVVSVIASVRESLLEDVLLSEAVRTERETRPIPNPDDGIDDVTAVALAAACCEQWWTSAGTNHDPATCTRRQAS